jgi:HAMP domain-containing protein
MATAWTRLRTPNFPDKWLMCVLTVKPPPPLILSVWPVLLDAVLLTGFLLLIDIAPFAALFGFIMSRGLTHRLGALTRAADAWSEGNFALLPQDRSEDEICQLGVRLRYMAECIQALLQARR